MDAGSNSDVVRGPMTSSRPHSLNAESLGVPTIILGFLLAIAMNSRAGESLGEGLQAHTAGSSNRGAGELLVGAIEPAQLLDTHPRFAQGYEAFKAEPLELPDDVSVLLFFGTWCHDSEREVPRLLKLLETAGLSGEKLTLVGLNYRKRDPEGRAVQFDIRYTPTAIILREGVEVGRIVERPKTSLREEIIGILAQSGR